ncbi:methyl-accepting chemotaxis protein [Vreelandella jeotgali]|uniref:methyl-accepting chemotaxis protein n=1 Tax=Vreelandella jeotgali TaxID=553386 RepID=UPI0012E9E825|nr:methyl-accepting chemotaxis protein [Halomonas jeotgali]
MTTPPVSSRRIFGLQAKMLGLALVPLLLVTIALVVYAAYSRAQDTNSSLAHQRDQLIEERKQAVKQTVNAAKTAIAPIYDNDRLNTGYAKERAAEILRSIRFDNDNYIFAYDYDGTNIVTAPMPEIEGTDMIDTQAPDGTYILRDIIDVAKSGSGFTQYPWENPNTNTTETKYSYVESLDKWDWALGAGVYVTSVDDTMAKLEAVADADLKRNIWISVVISAGLFIIVALVAYGLVQRVVRPIRRTAGAMHDIAQGRGDLTRRLTVESRDEIGNLATQFNAFVQRMQETLLDVRKSSVSVHDASGHISHSSSELATRTEQAAANLQQTSASMEEITSTVNNSAESAQQANQLVMSTAEVAHRGEEVMGQVETTMQDINTSANRISEIITMIDGIAFQTNILALNASVEAARAGEHGRGFAVVAEEVRTLASRSGEASREIRELIDTSVKHTQSGAEQVRNAGGTMQEIVSSVERVTDVIGEITAGAKEQSAGIGQINTAVAEMDTMTQQNASMVQESTTAAADMRRYAEHLTELIHTFVLGDDASGSDLKRPALSSSPQPRPAPAPGRQPQASASSSQSDDDWEEF